MKKTWYKIISCLRNRRQLSSICCSSLFQKITKQFGSNKNKFYIICYYFCQYREYPCDHYTSVIAVTLVMCGCPRVEVPTTALQLLQILDKRFFGTTSVLQGEKEKGT